MLFLSFHLYISSLCKGFIYFCFVLMLFSFLWQRYESHFNPSSFFTWFPVNALKSCPQKRHTATNFLVELIVVLLDLILATA